MPGAPDARWFGAALEHAPTPTLLCTGRGQIKLANHAARHLLARAGCPPPAGRQIQELLNLASEPDARFAELLDGTRDHAKLTIALGTSRWPVEARLAAYPVERTRCVHLELHDTRRRMEQEAEMRARLEFKQQLIEAIPLPLCLRDFDGKFVRINRAFEQWHNVLRHEVIGQRASDVLPASVTLAFCRCDARALASTQPIDEEVELRPRDGASRRVQLRVQAIREGSALDGFIAIEFDVTRMREQEAQLSSLNEQLEHVSALVMDAQERERRKVAQDLHDDVGQVLTALKLTMASMARSVEPISSADLRAASDLIDEVLQRIRDVSATLYPQVLDDLGIEAAINWLIERFIRPSFPGISFRCRLEQKRSFHSVEISIFRVVQEALTNVIRHSGASRAGVLVEGRDGELQVEVIDDGGGFASSTTWFSDLHGRSIGLTSMRKRIEEIGGELFIDSSPGSGTSIRARVPWHALETKGRSEAS